MQYGSIGWAVGATLGVATAVGHIRKVVSLIGDLSLNVTLTYDIPTLNPLIRTPLLNLYPRNPYPLNPQP